MATTATLTKINFMSEDSFNALSTLDNQQLYAVEATGLITSVMNSNLNTVYPVGSIYITTANSCPLATLISGSSWTIVAKNIVLSVNSTAPVVGNGKAVGMTNGTTNFGLSNQGGAAYKSALVGYTGSYNGSVGVTRSGTEIGTNVNVGLTTDASKSGMVANITTSSLTVNIFKRTA